LEGGEGLTSLVFATVPQGGTQPVVGGVPHKKLQFFRGLLLLALPKSGGGDADKVQGKQKRQGERERKHFFEQCKLSSDKNKIEWNQESHG
jgi:hypothetical protein